MIGMLIFCQVYNDITSLLLAAAVIGLGFGAVQSSGLAIGYQVNSSAEDGFSGLHHYCCTNARKTFLFPKQYHQLYI